MYSFFLRKKYKLFFFFVSVLFVPHIYAANLIISPETLFVEKGKSFVVSFYISDNTTSINALSAELNYPKDLLQLNSFSKNGSILQMWSEDPSFSNTEGRAHFEGVILNPGFSSRKGLVLTANFTPKETGVATLRLVSGNVYANDGKATDVLSLLGTATYTITEKSANTAYIAKTSSVSPKVLNGIPLITSKTHPSEDSWYSEKTIATELALDAQASELRYAFTKAGQKSDVQISKPLSDISLHAKEDGVYSLFVKQKIGDSWTKASEYQINIDTKAPVELTVTLPFGKSSSRLFQKVHLSAKDDLSGMSHFEISLNKSSAITIVPDENGEADVDMPKASLGVNTLEVAAYDKANNVSTIVDHFTVTALADPLVQSYTKEIKAGDFFSLSAKTYPGARLLIHLQNDREIVDKTLTADERGDATLATLLGKPGNYEMFLKVSQYEDGESVLKKVGAVRVAYSFSWLLSPLGVQGMVSFSALFFVALTASLLTLLITKSEFFKIWSLSFFKKMKVRKNSIFANTIKREGNDTPPEGGF